MMIVIDDDDKWTIYSEIEGWSAQRLVNEGAKEGFKKYMLMSIKGDGLTLRYLWCKCGRFLQSEFQ